MGNLFEALKPLQSDGWAKAMVTVTAKAAAAARQRAADRSGVNDLPGGEASRWAANRIDDGFTRRDRSVLSRADAEAIVKVARAGASLRPNGRVVKPGFNVSRSEAAIRKRLVAYHEKLNQLAKAGKPPTMLIATSISRDVATLGKYERRQETRDQRWMDADHPEINREMYDDDPGFDEFYQPAGPRDI